MRNDSKSRLMNKLYSHSVEEHKEPEFTQRACEVGPSFGLLADLAGVFAEGRP